MTQKKYAVGICESTCRPKHRSGPTLIFMKFRLCRPSTHTATLSRVCSRRAIDFCRLNVESPSTFDFVTSVYWAEENKGGDFQNTQYFENVYDRTFKK